MDIVNYSEARANLKSVMDRVVDDCMPIAITRQRGKPVVLVSLDEWNSIQETMYLMSSPKSAQRLMDAIEDAKAGRNMIEVDPETMQPIVDPLKAAA